MGDVSGIQLLQLWKQRKARYPVYLFTGDKRRRESRGGDEAGAFHYVTKHQRDRADLLIRRAVDGAQKDKEIDNLRRRLDQNSASIRSSVPIQVDEGRLAKIQRAAQVDSTVLILGETGTGKELSPRLFITTALAKKGPFVPSTAPPFRTLVERNCSATSRRIPGATIARRPLRTADGGTLFIERNAISIWVYRPNWCACSRTLTLRR